MMWRATCDRPYLWVSIATPAAAAAATPASVVVAATNAAFVAADALARNMATAVPTAAGGGLIGGLRAAGGAGVVGGGRVGGIGGRPRAVVMIDDDGDDSDDDLDALYSEIVNVILDSEREQGLHFNEVYDFLAGQYPVYQVRLAIAKLVRDGELCPTVDAQHFACAAQCSWL
jgi:hypothetical protein